MANSLQATKRGKIIPDAVNVIVSGGKVFEGWKSVRISKNLESIANSFSLEIDDRFEDSKENWPIKPGVSVKINIGDERVVTGRIEKLDASFDAGGRRFNVQGRSFPGDLVDCSHVGANEYTNIGLKELAEELVKPFGLRVFLSVEPKQVDRFAVKPGESVFSALNRAARLQGFFWISTREGNIRLTRAARARAIDQLTEDVNLLSGSISLDISQRHSQYIVKGQTAGLPNFSGANASQPEGSATDKGIGFHRPLIVIAEGSVDADTATTRAQWEATNRTARGSEVQVTVQGWRQSDGSLWGINQLIHVHSRYLGLFTDMLSTTVEHSQDSSGGTITNMTLVPPNSFAPKAEIKAKDDIISRIGASRKGKT